LEEDLAYYYGKTWRSTLRPSLATQRYVDRIHEVGNSGSYLLVAHQYTRYLGDLFGGQMMAGMATKSLGLEEGKGIRFYDFPDIKNNKAFIEEWYSEVNRLGFSEKESAALVEEANRVFTLNIGVFDELEGNALEAVAKFAFETFVEKLKIANPVVRAAIERESESESMSESAAA
jgi:heme oxygenase